MTTSGPVAQPAPQRSSRPGGRPSWPQARTAVVECVVLAVACLITYWLARNLLSRVYSVSRDDDLLGGLWAVLATIFVLRDSFGKSVAAAVSRMSATFVSFVLCLIYLAFLPFHAWALAVLVGASALVVMLLGRPGDAVTAGITTAVIMVVAAVSPQHAWQQPILRLADTIIGVAVGALAAWVGLQVKRLLPARSVLPAPAKVKIDLSERAVVRRPRPGLPHLSATRWERRRWLARSDVSLTLATSQISPQSSAATYTKRQDQLGDEASPAQPAVDETAARSQRLDRDRRR
jgi:hypothetical protein